MPEPTRGAGDAAAQELTITRIFAAPRDLVFKAHTERDHLARWWGPKGFTMLQCSVDLRPNGLFHYCMRAPDGREMWGKLVFREIRAPELLVFVVSFSDEQANTIRNPFSADWPLEVLNTLTFSEQNSQTTLTLRGVPINASQSEYDAFSAGHDSVRQGMALLLDQLAEYLDELQATRNG